MSDFERLVRRKLEREQRMRNRKRKCCKDVNNLRYAVAFNNRRDVVVLQCKHCKRLHYQFEAETGRIGFTKT